VANIKPMEIEMVSPSHYIYDPTYPTLISAQLLAISSALLPTAQLLLISQISLYSSPYMYELPDMLLWLQLSSNVESVMKQVNLSPLQGSIFTDSF
jgi:hypothetical protein